MSTSANGADRVIIFDTTLRDGEQSPGATMTFEEKLDVADLLVAMGVDVIEAGFPIASDGDFESVLRNRQAVRGFGDLRSRPGSFQGHRPLRRGHQARQARPHPHLHRHLAAAS